MYALNQGVKPQLYDHMRKIDFQYWTIKLLEARFVDNISELSQMEKKWINMANPQYILTIDNANKTNRYYHKSFMIADKIIKPILDELLDEVINEMTSLFYAKHPTLLYKCMREVGIENWRIKILDVKFVNSITELDKMEKECIEREGCVGELSFKD